MTKLEELKAAGLAACDTYLDARARADAGYTADTRAAFLAYDAAFYAYQVELKKTQGETE
jgi:hypothetical protein